MALFSATAVALTFSLGRLMLSALKKLALHSVALKKMEKYGVNWHFSALPQSHAHFSLTDSNPPISVYTWSKIKSFKRNYVISKQFLAIFHMVQKSKFAGAISEHLKIPKWFLPKFSRAKKLFNTIYNFCLTNEVTKVQNYGYYNINL